MNLALNVEAGAGTAKAAGANAAMQPAGGRAAWLLDIGQSASWPAEARSALDAHSFSESASFQSNWQLMLRTWGGANGAGGEGGSTSQDGAAENSATKFETADATGSSTTNQGLASFPATANAFARLSAPVAPNNPPAAAMLRLESTQPPSGATASGGRPQAFLPAIENRAQKPPRSLSSEASGKGPESRNAIGKRQESGRNNPPPVSPASAVFAVSADTSLPAAMAAPAAIQAQAASPEFPPAPKSGQQASSIAPAELPPAPKSAPQAAFSAPAKSPATPEFRPDVATSAPAESPAAPELRPAVGSPDRITQRESNSTQTQAPPPVSEMETASRPGASLLPASPETAAVHEAGRSLPDPHEFRMSASQNEPREVKTSGSFPAAPNQPASGAENPPAVSPHAKRPEENDGTQPSSPPPQVEPGESREVRKINVQAVSVQPANAPPANGGAPRPVEPSRPGWVEVPAAHLADQWTPNSSVLAMGEARNAAVPEAKAAATNSSAISSAKRSTASTVNSAAGVSGWVHAPESVQAAVIAKPIAAAVAGRTAPAAANETFAALDTGTAVGAPKWIHAGGQKAEAGFEDPALGWVGVRADLNGGSVHAALVPATAEAGQALGAHMAGLSAYLAEQHSPVAELTLADSTVGAGAAGGQGAGQNPAAEDSAHAETSGQSGSRVAAGAPAQSASTAAGEPEAVFSAGGLRGGHISVMA